MRKTTLQISLSSDEECVNFQKLSGFYDLKHRVCIHIMKIDRKLDIGSVYDFRFENGEDSNCYTYKVLKKANNAYYLAEYYDKLITTDEKYLGSGWTKGDAFAECGINLDNPPEDENLDRESTADNTIGSVIKGYIKLAFDRAFANTGITPPSNALAVVDDYTFADALQRNMK